MKNLEKYTCERVAKPLLRNQICLLFFIFTPMFEVTGEDQCSPSYSAGFRAR